jgi:hypothetical protein
MAAISGANIVTDGLIFYIDPSNPNSVSGIGTSIYNLANSSEAGTFVGYTSNPIDNTENRSIIFDGIDDYILCNAISQNNNASALTWIVWAKRNASNSLMTFLQYSSLTSDISLELWSNGIIYFEIGNGGNTYGELSNNSSSWQNIAMVFDGSGVDNSARLKAYINGVQQNLTYGGTTIPSTAGSGNNLYIGNTGPFSSFNSNLFSSGNFGSFQSYNRALSATEILQNYNATKKKYNPDENIVTNGLIFNIDANKNASYPGSGSYIYDLSGFNNTGTLSNSPSFSGANGGSLAFNGTNSFVNFGNKFSFTTESFAFTYWVFVNSFTTNQANQGPIVFYKGNFNENGYYSQIGSDGSFGFNTNNGSSQYSVSSVGVIKLKKWHHISIVRNGSSVRLYCDGVDVTTTVATHQNPSASSRDFYLANYNNFIFANIQISQFLLHNRVLSVAEVLQNYNATKNRFVKVLPPVSDGLILNLDAGNRASYAGTGTTWTDLSSDGLRASLINGPVFAGTGISTYFSFDGSNDYVSIPTTLSVNASAFSFEVVFRITTGADGNTLLSLNYTAPNAGYLVRQTTGNYLIIYSDNGTETSISSTAALSNNTTYHIVVVQSSNSCSIYINGILDKTASLSNPVLTITNENFLGRRGAPAYGAQLTGNIYLSKLYNKALSSTEILQNFNFYRSRYGI